MNNSIPDKIIKMKNVLQVAGIFSLGKKKRVNKVTISIYVIAGVSADSR